MPQVGIISDKLETLEYSKKASGLCCRLADGNVRSVETQLVVVHVGIAFHPIRSSQFRVFDDFRCPLHAMGMTHWGKFFKQGGLVAQIETLRHWFIIFADFGDIVYQLAVPCN